MPEPAPGQQEIQGLLTIPRHLDPAVGVEIAQEPQGKLHLQRVVLDHENVGRAGQWDSGKAGQRCRHELRSSLSMPPSTVSAISSLATLRSADRLFTGSAVPLSGCPPVPLSPCLAPPPCCPRVM